MGGGQDWLREPRPRLLQESGKTNDSSGNGFTQHTGSWRTCKAKCSKPAEGKISRKELAACEEES